MVKMVVISINFFGKPEREFGGKKITAETIRAKGNELKQRLSKIATAIEKLTAKKWNYQLVGNNLSFTKKIPEEDAKIELKKIGIKEDAYEFTCTCSS